MAEQPKLILAERYGISLTDIENICQKFKYYIKKNNIQDVREFLKNRRSIYKDKIKEDKLKELLTTDIENKSINTLKILYKLFKNDIFVTRFIESINESQFEVQRNDNKPRSHLSSYWTKDEIKKLQSNLNQIIDQYKIPDIKKFILEPSIEDKKFKKDINFRELLTEGLNKRTENQVFQKAYFMIQKNTLNSKWTPEEIQRLELLQHQFGSKWKKIGKELNRHPNDCSTKFRSLKKVSGNIRNTGEWTKSECKLLRKAVRSLTNTPKNTFVFENIPWIKVAQIVRTRNSVDCRKHWLFTFSCIKRDKIKQNFNRDIFNKIIIKIEENDAKLWKNIDWKSLWLKYDEGNFTPSPPALAIIVKRYIRRTISTAFTADAKMKKIIGQVKEKFKKIRKIIQ